MFKKPSEFSLHIEQLAYEQKLGLIDVILQYCEENYIEPNDIAKLINKSLRDKLEVEFINGNYIKGGSTLGFL